MRPFDQGTHERTRSSHARARRIAWLMPLLLVLAFATAAWAGYHRLVLGGDQYDDSFITYRYAANLADGRGLTFNSYERVNSASSLLYACVLAGARRIGLARLELVAAAMGALAGAGGLLVAYRLVLLLGGSPILGFIVLLPVAVSGAWTGWSASGMETIPYAALATAFVAAFALRRRLLVLFLLSACLLTRPEGVLLFIAAMAVELYLHGRSSALLVALACTGGVVLGLLYGFYDLYYGSWLPQAAELKTISPYYAPGPLAQLRSTARFCLGGFGALTAGAVAPLFHGLRRRDGPATEADSPARLRLTTNVFLILTAGSLVLGPHSDLMRYAVPALPLLGVASAAAWLGVRATLRPRARTLIALLFVAISIGESAVDGRRTHAFFVEWSRHQAARRSLGRWLDENAPDKALVISSDLGAIAYEALRLDFYDMVGLLSRGPLEAARRNRWDLVWSDLGRRKPQYLCDTVLPDGEPQALHVLREPYRYFRSVQADTDPALYPSRSVIRSIDAGQYKFEIAALRWGNSARGDDAGAGDGVESLPPSRMRGRRIDPEEPPPKCRCIAR
ncbi:MAG TPA: hypothetical protein VF363_02465 [Candidatus Eisenbacteria bacterium]